MATAWSTANQSTQPAALDTDDYCSDVTGSGARQSDRISVVVPTRGRGAMVVRTIRSIMRGDILPRHVIVVDQSRSDDTAQAVADYLGCTWFRYIRTDTIGISAARNIGGRAAATPLIATTDDDCEVRPDWLGAVLKTFDEHPEASIVLGNVSAGSHPPCGFIPAYQVARLVFARGVKQKHRVEGIGACLAYRTEVWRELNGFDELLGVGAPLASAEEVDFMIRALGKGHTICEAPEVGVVHHGFRTFEQGRELISGYLCGIGAVSAKHLRRNWASYSQVLARLAARWAWGGPVVNFGHAPSRRLRLYAFLRGFREGWKLSCDRNGHFTRNDARAREEAVLCPLKP